MTDTFAELGATTPSYPDQADPPPDGRRRLVLVLAGGLAALTVAGAGMVLASGGDSPEATVIPLAAVAPRAAAPLPPVEPQTVPVANTEDFARNPFEPKYVAPPPAPAATVAPDITVPTGTPLPLDLDAATGLGSSGTVELSPVPGPVSNGTGSAGPSGGGTSTVPAPVVTEAPAVDYPITLVSVGSEPDLPVLTWTIEGTKNEVIAGQRFGRYGELVVLATTKQGEQVTGAVLQVGDAAPVVVSIGETVKVQ